MFEAYHCLLRNRLSFMQYLFSQTLSLFSKAKTLNFLIGPKHMLNCVEYIYIVNTKYKGHGATTWLKRGQFLLTRSSAKNITVSHETSTIFLRNLSHVLTITDFLVFHPPKKQRVKQEPKKASASRSLLVSGLANTSYLCQIHSSILVIVISNVKNQICLFFQTCYKVMLKAANLAALHVDIL